MEEVKDFPKGARFVFRGLFNLSSRQNQILFANYDKYAMNPQGGTTVIFQLNPNTQSVEEILIETEKNFGLQKEILRFVGPTMDEILEIFRNGWIERHETGPENFVFVFDKNPELRRLGKNLSSFRQTLGNKKGLSSGPGNLVASFLSGESGTAKNQSSKLKAKLLGGRRRNRKTRRRSVKRRT